MICNQIDYHDYYQNDPHLVAASAASPISDISQYCVILHRHIMFLRSLVKKMSQQELCDNIFGCNSYVEVVHLIFFNGYGLQCLLILC